MAECHSDHHAKFGEKSAGILVLQDSPVHTVIEYDPYSSMFYISSLIVACSPEKDNKSTVVVMPDSAIVEDKEMLIYDSPSLSYYADSILLLTMVDDPLPF